MRPLLVVLALLLLSLSGCGGGGARSRPADLGAASFGDLQAGWHTDFGHSLVTGSQFRSGGPGKDGIPALTRLMSQRCARRPTSSRASR